MKNSQLALIVSVLLVTIGTIAFGITNPNKEEYQKYGAAQLSQELQEKGCEKIPQSFGNFLQTQCKLLIEQMNPELQGLIEKNTQRKNFLLFSIYVTDLTLPTPLPSYHFETLAGLNHFWVLKAEEQNSSN